MSQTLHALDYLAAPAENAAAAVCVCFGDELFLQRLVLQSLRTQVLGTDEADVPFAQYSGKSAQWRDVVDELSTASLFSSGPRLVIIDEADDFIRKHRDQLEKYVAAPRLSGVLVLAAQKWPSNTKLYKAIDKSGRQIDCRAPEKTAGRRKVLDEGRVCKWIAEWGRSSHDVKLSASAAELMFELIGPEFGLLDQGLAKLALFAGAGGKATPEMVRDIVGGWRTKTTWELIDLVVDGKADQALLQLDRLLLSGENALALFGQISWSLRRFAAATRVFQAAQRDGRRMALRDALLQAGFRQWPKTALENAERQLKQLSQQRAGQLYRWLLDADLALKGSHSTPDRSRQVLEQLFVRMSTQLRPAPPARARR